MEESKAEIATEGDVAYDVDSTSTGEITPLDLRRKLKSRHIQFIAIGGTIGTGLFLGIGSALATAGPLSLFLGYTFTGVAIYAMMQCLGEMTTWLPLPGAIGQLMARFVDESLGFAIGWNQWYNVSIGICAEISAAVALVDYWDDTISSAAWISVILVVIVILNIFTVRFYGEAEFIFASIKIITIIGLLILAVVLCLGGGPNHDRLGFRYWKSPGAMKSFVAPGAAGRFLALFNTFINAAFAYGGIEQLAVAAGETSNPTKAIPKAIRRVFWRIAIFYILGSFAVGIIVPSSNQNLLTGTGISSSPWVIAIQNAGIRVLPSIINAVIITSASSAANANLYTGSRYIYALAVHGQAPKIFLKCTKSGVPIYCVSITASVGLLTYMTISSGGARVFGWFSHLVAIAYLITWTAICGTYIRFRQAMDYNGIDPASQDFRAPFGSYLAWFGLIFFSIVIIFNGFPVFTTGRWDIQDFVTAYIGLPIVLVLYFGWKIVKGAKILDLSQIDINTGRENIYNARNVQVVPDKKKNIMVHFWDWAV